MPRLVQLIIVAIAIFSFSLWAQDFDELLSFVRIFIFQTRDLDRANSLLNGWMIYYGPETTGGGQLPGPFYYYLLAFGLLFDTGWPGSYFILVGLSAACAALGWLYFRERISANTAFLWLGLFLLSAPLQNFIGVFLNVSHQIFFVAFAIICACEAFREGEADGRRNFFIAACMLVSLTIQLHYSALVLGFALGFMQWLSPRFGVSRLPLPAIGWGLLAAALPLLPYLVWVASGKRLGQPAAFSGEVRDALPAMFSFIDWPNWMRVWKSLGYLLNAVPLALPVAAVAYFLDRKPQARTPMLWPVTICAVCGAVPALYVFIAPIGIRYGMTLTVAALFLTAALLHSGAGPTRHRAFTLLAVLLTCALSAYSIAEHGFRDFDFFIWSRHGIVAACVAMAAAAAALVFKERLWIGSFVMCMVLALVQNPSLWVGDLARHQMSAPSNLEWRYAALEICERTGWNIERIFDSLYFVNGHMELDPRSSIRSMLPDCPQKKDGEAPDGFFVTFQIYVGEWPFKDWLMYQSVSSEIKDGLRDGGIELEEPVEVGTLLLVPYHVKNRQKLPTHFHNIGYGYTESKWQVFLRRWSSKKGAVKLNPNSYLLSWNDCENGHPYCLAGAVVKTELGPKSTKLQVNVIGDALSQSSPWITPTWTVMWSQPYIEVQCPQEKRRIELARTIGYNREYGFNSEHYQFYLSNHSLLTPFRREIEVDCRATGITLGRAGGTVDLIQMTRPLPARQQTIAL